MPPVEYKDESMSATAAVAGDNINVTSTSAPTKGKRVSWTQDRVGAHVHDIFVLTIYLIGNMVFTAFLKSSICSLTPEHLQSSVFAIAELTQKGTSIFSPLLLLGLLAGVADENTGENNTWRFRICVIPWYTIFLPCTRKKRK